MLIPVVCLQLGKGGDPSQLLQRVEKRKAHEDISKAWNIKGGEGKNDDHDISMQSEQTLDISVMLLPDLDEGQVKIEGQEDVRHKLKVSPSKVDRRRNRSS